MTSNEIYNLCRRVLDAESDTERRLMLSIIANECNRLTKALAKVVETKETEVTPAFFEFHKTALA